MLTNEQKEIKWSQGQIRSSLLFLKRRCQDSVFCLSSLEVPHATEYPAYILITEGQFVNTSCDLAAASSASLTWFLHMYFSTLTMVCTDALIYTLSSREMRLAKPLKSKKS